MKDRITSRLTSRFAADNGVWMGILLAMLWLCAGRAAWGQGMNTGEVIEGDYSNCHMEKASPSMLRIFFTVKFKAVSGSVAGRPFLSRAIGGFGYDKTGKPDREAIGTQFFEAYINNTHARTGQSFDYYNIRHAGESGSYPMWRNPDAFTANVFVYVPANGIGRWPALAMQVANIATDGTLVFEKSGAIYLSLDSQSCQLIDPTKPAPSPFTTEITVTAPDWDLGELERGKETTRTFATNAEQLCLRYDPQYIEFDRYLISASNRNGVADNRFLLANAEDISETIPYTLSLAGSGAPVVLPNIDGLPLTLGKSGQTCLTPTFKVWVGAGVKAGDFSDVVTFTITTQP